jgi:hypothetical protein
VFEQSLLQEQQQARRPWVACAAQTSVLQDLVAAAVPPQQLVQELQQQLWRANSVQYQEQRRQRRYRGRQVTSVPWLQQEHNDAQQQEQQQQQQALPHGLAAVLSGIEQQQQQLLHEPYIPADTAAGRDRQLTAHITRRRHWTQLQAIWLDNTTNFSPVHLTATVVRLARLVEAQGVAPADRPELFKFSSAVLSSIHLTSDALDPRGAVQCLWAYAKLQSLAPHRSSSGDAAADALAALTAASMQQLQQQELSQAAWSAAVLQPAGLSLPNHWWRDLFVRLQQLLPQVQPAEVACCAWAAAKVRVRPHQECIDALLQHVQGESQQQQQQYGPRELLQLLQAVAAWQHDLSPEFQISCCDQLQQLTPQMSAQDVSQALLALARLQLQPRQQLLSALLQQLQQQLPRASLLVLVSVPYALAKLGRNPGANWWAGFLPYTTVALERLTASGLAVLAWALARLGLNPGKPWVHEVLQQSGYKMGGLAAQELAMLAWALGRWQAAPSVWWWERFEKVTVMTREDFTAAELAALLAGVAGMQLPPPVPAAAAAAAAGSGTATSASQQQQLQQQQQSFPSASWTAQLLAAAQRDLAGAPTDCLAGIFTGLAKLSVRPSAAWLDAFEAAACAALPQSGLSNAAAVLWGYAALGVQPSRQLVNSMNTRLGELLQDASTSSSRAKPAAAAAAAGYRHPASPPEAAAAAAPPPPDKPTAAVTAQLLWALVHQRGEYQAPWLDDLLHAVLPALETASIKSLAVMFWCMGKLRHGPANPRLLDAWWAAFAVRMGANSTTQPTASVQQQQQQQHPAEVSAAGVAAAAAAADRRTSLSLITAVLYCFARLNRTPSGTRWLGMLLEASAPLLPAASERQLANLLGQLVQLRVAPGDVWLGVAAQVLRQQWRRQQGADGKAALLNAQELLYQLGYGGPREGGGVM